MAEAETECGWTCGVCRYVVCLFAALLLYVLSIGPMFWVWYASFNDLHLDSSPWPTLFYLPLLYACQIGVVRDVVNWYINLWIL